MRFVNHVGRFTHRPCSRMQVSSPPWPSTPPIIQVPSCISPAGHLGLLLEAAHSHGVDLRLDLPAIYVDQAQRLHTKRFLLVAIIHARPAKKGFHVSGEFHEFGVDRRAEPYKVVGRRPDSHRTSRRGNRQFIFIQRTHI